ncbi:MAG TPA: ATPase, T2SS/T4P/T4SS family, partial [Calditrichia bacterium]|nr:ATPase, T2SS/T4P/T4SS family [Calditrichia bacterium]
MLQDNMFKLGKSLVSQNIVNFEVLEKAMKIKQTEELANRRNLAQILVNDFKADPDQVYREVAKLYGFDSVNLDDELFEDTRIKLIRKMVDRLPDSIKKSLHKQEVIPFDYQTTPPKLILAAVDPTNPLVISIARSLGARRHEVRHISRLQFKNFYEMILSPANAFLQNIELPDMDLLEDDSTPRDEEAIESEINKSFLVNLVEGMLLEAVRRKASDIHIIPRDINNTEILFRVDGRLQTWFAEKGIRPEALSAVVKDRSRNVDRFEREMAQDGFIQRNVDGHKIRYRVSVMPIVGSDVLNKLESIVIRVLDDRNVITDFRELGLQKQAHGDFMKAIRKPQGMVILTGPTGSGKSTTLLASLNHIVKPEINVL